MLFDGGIFHQLLGFVFLENQPDITKIDQQASPLPDDKYRIGPFERIDEQQSAAADGKKPEGDGHDGFAGAFTGNPLDHKAHRKHGLSHKTKDQPDVPLRDKNSIEPDLNVIPQS